MLAVERAIRLVDDADTALVSGVSLEMVTKGAGRPLLFLHGMDGVEAAVDLIDGLSQQFTVYAPSHPGFGASPLPRHFSTTDDLAYFYLDLLDHLNLVDVTIVGMSFGAWIAAEILIKDRSRIRDAVLGAPLGLRTGNRRQRVMPDLFMLPPQAADAMQYADRGAAPSNLASLPDQHLRRVLRNRESMTLFGWSPYLNDPKLGQRLHRVSCPTLLIWGTEDVLTPREYQEAYAAALPRAQVAMIKGGGHRFYSEQPNQTCDLIVGFASGTIEAQR